jgi:hypothetical protein
MLSFLIDIKSVVITGGPRGLGGLLGNIPVSQGPGGPAGMMGGPPRGPGMMGKYIYIYIVIHLRLQFIKHVSLCLQFIIHLSCSLNSFVR